MRQATAVLPSGTWDRSTAIDSVELDAQDRYRRRVVLAGAGGATYLLNLAEPAHLRDGDGLVLDDGVMLLVAAKAEKLTEIVARSAHELARIGWHLGNRHIDVQILGERLRIRRDHVIEAMLIRLGARLIPVEAPFDPESGAYSHHHAHAHGHDDAKHGS